MALVTPPRKPLAPDVGAVLEFTEGEDRGRRIPLAFTRTVLGRKFGDILVRDIKVSSTHVALEVRNGAFWVIDLKSSNGTFVRGEKITQAPINPGEDVRIGLSAFKLLFDPALAVRLSSKRPSEVILREGGLSEVIREEFEKEHYSDGQKKGDALQHAILLEILSGPLKGKVFKREKSQTVIGRTSADIVIPDADVSRKHAMLELQEGGQVILRDLGSRNGTFVNDKKIANHVLTKRDRIRVGHTLMLFTTAED